MNTKFNRALAYTDGTYEVEQFDHVELRLNGFVFEGQVTKVHPRIGQVTVRYDDYEDPQRDGTPRQRGVRVPVADVDLVRRDG